MKHIMLVILLLATFATQVFSQNPNIVYSDVKAPVQRGLPNSRIINGGTIINIEYHGSGFSKAVQGAFEYACKLIEEQVPTTFPLYIVVEFGNLSNTNALAMVLPNITQGNYSFDKVYEKRYAQNYSNYENFSDSDGLSFFRDTKDFTIKFSRNQPFDYNIDPTNISANKYDFITVALQALIKGLGFCCQFSCYNNQLYISTPSNKYSNTILTEDPAQNYVKATSGTVSIPSSTDDSQSWLLECGSTYRQGISLNYLSNNNVQECNIMQYGIAKGSYIRNIGSFLKDFFSFCGWDMPIATGMSGTYIDEVSSDDVIAYQGEDVLSRSNTSLSSSHNSYAVIEEEDYGTYMRDRREVGAEGTYVLLKNGAWREFSSLQDLSDNVMYARTVDGYLRLKEIKVQYGPDYNYQNWNVSYRLYDYIPQIPEAALSSYTELDYYSTNNARNAYRSQNSLSVEDIFVEVEVEFKNIEGTSYVMVEQTDADYPYPYTYFVDDISSGQFSTYMNMRYPSTFQLTYINDNGQVVGEPFTIDLTGNVNARNVNRGAIKITEDILTYDVENQSNETLRYTITNLSTGRIVEKNSLSGNSGTLNTSNLGKGVYAISMYLSGDKIAELKWER